jgi:uroporphyrinogen-III synthase
MIVIVTRPGAAGERLRRRLSAAGMNAVWWPAFELGPAPDPAAVQARLARLEPGDLAIFVSPNAVHSVRELLGGRWPAGVRIGAVGAATRDAVLDELGVAERVVIAPGDDGSGSEAFWSAWQASGLSAPHVLLLRAEGGRDWLAERFAEVGAAVELLAVYTRRAAPLPAGAAQQLRVCIESHAPAVTVFSSSEAVAAIDEQLRPIAGAAAFLRAGDAIATHARIARRLRAAGYASVTEADADDDALIAKLESLRK